MSEDPGDFLSRWSRRKREARQEPRGPEPAPEPLAAPTEAEPELTPEEIAALPPVEELTADSDVTAFLRKGIPDSLRNAALRRIWSLDPRIRDHVGDARDYAWDWNVPGGVPGNGPLLPTDNVSEMLKNIFRYEEPQPPAQVAEAQAGTAEAPSEPEAATPDEAAEEPPQLVSVRLDDGSEPGAEPPDGDPVPVAGGSSPLRVPARRHGGAKPV